LTLCRREEQTRLQYKVAGVRILEVSEYLEKICDEKMGPEPLGASHTVIVVWFSLANY
jgi:hypothetical protein